MFQGCKEFFYSFYNIYVFSPAELAEEHAIEAGAEEVSLLDEEEEKDQVNL